MDQRVVSNTPLGLTHQASQPTQAPALVQTTSSVSVVVVYLTGPATLSAYEPLLSANISVSRMQSFNA